MGVCTRATECLLYEEVGGRGRRREKGKGERRRLKRLKLLPNTLCFPAGASESAVFWLQVPERAFWTRACLNSVHGVSPSRACSWVGTLPRWCRGAAWRRARGLVVCGVHLGPPTTRRDPSGIERQERRRRASTGHHKSQEGLPQDSNAPQRR